MRFRVSVCVGRGWIGVTLVPCVGVWALSVEARQQLVVGWAQSGAYPRNAGSRLVFDCTWKISGLRGQTADGHLLLLILILSIRFLLIRAPRCFIPGDLLCKKRFISFYMECCCEFEQTCFTLKESLSPRVHKKSRLRV